MAGLGLGPVGTVLTFFGLERTRVGGDQRCKDSPLAAASVIHLLCSDWFWVFFPEFIKKKTEHLAAGSPCFLHRPSCVSTSPTCRSVRHASLLFTHTQSSWCFPAQQSAPISSEVMSGI